MQGDPVAHGARSALRWQTGRTAILSDSRTTVGGVQIRLLDIAYRSRRPPPIH